MTDDKKRLDTLRFRVAGGDNLSNKEAIFLLAQIDELERYRSVFETLSSEHDELETQCASLTAKLRQCNEALEYGVVRSGVAASERDFLLTMCLKVAREALGDE